MTNGLGSLSLSLASKIVWLANEEASQSRGVTGLLYWWEDTVVIFLPNSWLKGRDEAEPSKVWRANLPQCAVE